MMFGDLVCMIRTVIVDDRQLPPDALGDPQASGHREVLAEQVRTIPRANRHSDIDRNLTLPSMARPSPLEAGALSTGGESLGERH
jgi:hypothetical protein